VLQAVLGTGQVWLALVAVMFALVGTFYYIRVVKLMYFDEPQDAGRIDARLDVSVLLSANGWRCLCWNPASAAHATVFLRDQGPVSGAAAT